MGFPQACPRILIVEDDPLVRANLRQAIEHSPGLELAGEAETVAGALALLGPSIDLVILDLGLPDGSGIDVLHALRADPALAGTRVLVFTLFCDEARVVAALGEGADGYLLKDTDPAELLRDIHATLEGAAPISPAAAAHLLRRFRAAPVAATATPAATLTPRETELLQLLSRGLSYAEAAQSLGISPHTVRDHVKNLYRKLGVNSRGEAVFEAVSSGMIRL